MAKSFDQLSTVTRTMANRMDKVVSKLVKKAATTAGRRAVETTRVDTGKARSNWRANLNAPAASGNFPPYAPGNKLGFGERANLTAAVAQHKSVISAFDIRRHQAVFISNGVSYIGRLNDGGPGTAPGLMAQQAVQAAQIALKGEKFLQSLVPKGGTGRFS